MYASVFPSWKRIDKRSLLYLHASDMVPLIDQPICQFTAICAAVRICPAECIAAVLGSKCWLVLGMGSATCKSSTHYVFVLCGRHHGYKSMTKHNAPWSYVTMELSRKDTTPFMSHMVIITWKRGDFAGRRGIE